MAEIVVVGSLNCDLVVRGPLPHRGETLIGDDFGLYPGGKGANQAVAAARLGGRVAMVGRLGQDPFAEVLRDPLREAGVDLEMVRTDPTAGTGIACIYVERSGHNRITVVPQANAKLSVDDVEAAEPILRLARVLMLQGEVPLAVNRKAAEWGHEHGLLVMLNPAPADRGMLDLLPFVDIMTPNEGELRALVPDADSLEGAAAHLGKRGARRVVATLGEQGVLLWQPQAYQRVAAPKVQAVDTTAAGDTFCGALAVGLAEGRTMTEAVRLGQAAAALAVTRLGALPSIPTRAEVEEFLRSQA